MISITWSNYIDSKFGQSSEEEGEDGEKRKKKKDKKKINTTSEGEVKTEEEKKGFMDKLKEKLPGHAKKPEDASAPVAAPVVVPPVEEAHPAEKKGILEKIKEKLPGYHPKSVEEEKKKESEIWLRSKKRWLNMNNDDGRFAVFFSLWWMMMIIFCFCAVLSLLAFCFCWLQFSYFSLCYVLYMVFFYI